MFAYEAKRLGFVPFKFKKPHPRTTLKKLGVSMHLVENNNYENDNYDEHICCSIDLYEGSYRAGYVSLETALDIDKSKKRVETHSRLDNYLQNLGIGTFIYYQIICWGLHNNYRVSSSTDPSEDAIRTWARLRNYFNIRYSRRFNRHYVLGKK